MSAPRGLDLAVVGGGPVGLATAIFARRAGLSVAVLDQRRPPIDKACGEGLMPDGVELLREMGVEIPSQGATRFHGIRYLDGERAAEARFAAGHGLGIRRPALHGALAARAAAVGAELRWGVRVRGVAESAAEATLDTSAGPLAASWVVGADGLASRLRRWAGLEGRARPYRRQGRQPRFGRRRHYRVEPWTDLVEVHWADGHEAYVTPVGRREVGVAMLISTPRRDGSRRPSVPSFERSLASFPALAARLRGCAVSSDDRGAGPLYRPARGVRRGRILLAGDAAGYLDAITGEGMALGFQQARALAAAVAAGRPADYERAARQLAATPFRLIRLLLLVERRPWLRRRVVAALEGDPELFARLLAVHARQARPRDLGLGGAARLLGGLLHPS